jgi:hypothetical protein
MKMKIAVLVLALAAFSAQAQTVSTSFTLGTAFTNQCQNITSQDGVTPPYEGPGLSTFAYCPAGSKASIQLVNDPMSPGNYLSMPCAISPVSDTRGAITPTNLYGSTVTDITCTAYYTYTYSGTITNTYEGMYVQQCGSGRGSRCVKVFKPVLIHGVGTLTLQ